MSGCLLTSFPVYCRDVFTSGTPAASSQDSSFGLCRSILVDTAMYSA